MITNVIIFKNTIIGAFTRPEFLDIDADKAAVQLARSLKLTEDDKVIKTYENLQMFYIGTFDDEKGEFNAISPQLMLDCGKLILEKKALNLVAEEVKE